MPVDVPFWSWINETTVALVTETSVFHWSINGDSAPQKVFDRADNLVGTQIIGYKTDTAMKWCMLTGIAGRVS